MSGRQRRHSIALVSDFFYPNVGGVENHIYQLAQCLMKRNHKVIIITHSYEEKIGLHFLTNNLRVYYLPLYIMYNQATIFALFGSLPPVRWILLEEEITIIHGHSSFSTLAHEAMFHGRILGLHTIFTDHSLFGFADISSIMTNKILEISLTDCSAVICVSHTSKENTVLRAKIQPERVYVIPNAIDPIKFTPVERKESLNRIRIIIMSRLVYRKGMDLLAVIIPKICRKHDKVDFVIGGDGPKRLLLEETVENHQLLERVQFLGAVAHDKVASVLNQGDIFLNTSLTEAFCIAILEAACCGLQVVSTRVGGVPEVLPDDIVRLSDANVPSLVQALDEVIERIEMKMVPSRQTIYDIVAPLYTWQKVAERTERVYNHALERKPITIKQRIRKILNCGWVCGKVFVVVLVADLLCMKLLDIIQPHHHKKQEKIKQQPPQQKCEKLHRPPLQSYSGGEIGCFGEGLKNRTAKY